MRIAVVFTGGTIGSALSGGLISPDPAQKNELLSGIDSDDIEIIPFEPYTTLSEQLNGEHITLLIRTVGELLRENFDGIIVTHGTDTLQYSAAALSIAFGGCNTPVVLVSANYILSDPRSNGRDNLRYAVKFIREGIGGVYVSYKNTGESPAIYIGSSLLPHAPYSDALRSVCGVYGYFEDEKYISVIGEPGKTGVGEYSLTKHSPVLRVTAYPGAVYPDASGYSAMLIETYHSGTLPTEDEEFVKFCRKTPAKKYAVGISEGNRYESTKLYEQLDIVEMPPISPIYAYMVLWREYGKGSENLQL